MLPNIKKSRLIRFIGNLQASLMKKHLTPVEKQSDVGLIILTNSLNCNKNCTQRADKSITALFKIKRSFHIYSSARRNPPTSRSTAYG